MQYSIIYSFIYPENIYYICTITCTILQGMAHTIDATEAIRGTLGVMEKQKASSLVTWHFSVGKAGKSSILSHEA